MTSFSNSPLMTGNKDKDDTTALGITLMGEFGGVKDANTRRELMKMAANLATKTFNQGELVNNYDDFQAHLDNRFYAPRDGVSGKNIASSKAMVGQFDDENAAKDAMQIASAARLGRLEDKYNAQFYYTPDEIANLKKTKGFDFSQVESRGNLGGYELFSYKPDIWKKSVDSAAQKVELQKQLQDLGLYEGKIDGDIGTKSKESIKSFQRAVGLKDDGVAGKQTKKKLQEVFAQLSH